MGLMGQMKEFLSRLRLLLCPMTDNAPPEYTYQHMDNVQEGIRIRHHSPRLIRRPDRMRPRGGTYAPTQIYEGSSEVIVWLGPSHDGELAIEVFRELVASPDRHLDLTFVPHVDERLVDRSYIAALFGIGDSEIWRRLWIVQECTMAQKLTFVSGVNAIKGEILLEALGHITRHGRSCCSNLIHGGHHPLEPFFTSDGNIKGRDYGDYRHLFSTAQIDLLDAMGTFRLQRAFDSRDKIYGLLGLAMGKYEGFLEPDYTMSVEQVYEKAALQFIRRTGRLDLLSHAMQKIGISVPSWAPDWRTQMTHDEFDAHWSRMRDLSLYHASAHTEAMLGQPGPGKLLLQGTVVDVVSVLGSELKDSSLNHIDSTLDEWQRIAEAREESTRARSPLWKVLMNDAVREWDVSENGYRGKRLDGRDYGAQVKEWRDLVRRGEDPRSSHFHLNNTLSNCMLNRRLLVSREHGYMGLGPARLRVGDVIAIFCGGHMCYILRNVEDDQLVKQADHGVSCYQLIGDAFVDGLMDGQGLTTAEAENSNRKHLVLI
ncbi:MAG: hypothetical protein Q9169_006521 [Polycauliona sp. 2 TL-2023]